MLSNAYLLAKSEPIQPKTSNILQKFCQPTLSDVSAHQPVNGTVFEFEEAGHTMLSRKEVDRLVLHGVLEGFEAKDMNEWRMNRKEYFPQISEFSVIF